MASSVLNASQVRELNGSFTVSWRVPSDYMDGGWCTVALVGGGGESSIQMVAPAGTHSVNLLDYPVGTRVRITVRRNTTRQDSSIVEEVVEEMVLRRDCPRREPPIASNAARALAIVCILMAIYFHITATFFLH